MKFFFHLFLLITRHITYFMLWQIFTMEEFAKEKVYRDFEHLSMFYFILLLKSLFLFTCCVLMCESFAFVVDASTVQPIECTVGRFNYLLFLIFFFWACNFVSFDKTLVTLRTKLTDLFVRKSIRTRNRNEHLLW